MARIVSTVKPREIIIHLPCLTEHDRESIEAKNDFSGNFEAMKLLLNCMKRRDNWPEQFITALEECDYGPIAAEIRAEYDKLRGINNSSTPPPASPAANVVTAHVHPAPSAPHLPDPGPVASALPSKDVPSETHEAYPIQETETPAQSTPAKPAAPVVENTTTPEPPQVPAEPQAQAVVVPPTTPPPSPESARDSTDPSAPPEQVDFISHQEPEENLEPDIVQAQVDVPNETVTIQQEAEEDTEASLAADPREEPCEVGDSMETITLVDEPPPALPVEKENVQSIEVISKPIVVEPEPVTAVVEVLTQSTATVEEDSLTTTIVDNPIVPPVAAEVSAGRSASPMTNLDDLILTPEKPPVQETSPKEEKVPTVVPVLEETPEPQNTKVVQIVQEIEVALPPSPLPVEMENGEADQGSVSEEEDICFSKPGVLMSVAPSDLNNTTMCPPSPDPAPYSGDSGRLEMSEVEKSVPSCQENGISHKQPDKDVSESPAPSLDVEDVEENVEHVAEEPSILNKEAQMPLIEDNGEPTKEVMTTVPFVPATALISDPLCCSNADDMSESPAPSLDVEDVEENLSHVMDQPSILNPENQTPLTENAEEQAMELTLSSTTVISDISCCPNKEDISESPAPSLDMEDVRENVGHVAEEPSLLNLDVQTPLLHANGESVTETTTATVSSDIAFAPNVEQEADRNLNQEVQTPIIQVNGEPAKEITTAPATNDNHQPNDPLVDQKLPTSRLNTRHILTAAGVGACALLIAWRLKH